MSHLKENLFLATILLILSIDSVHNLERLTKIENIAERTAQQGAPTNRSDASHILRSSDDFKEDLPTPDDLSVIRINDTSVVLRWEFGHTAQESLQFFKIQYKLSKKNSRWKTEDKEIPATARAYQINGLRPGNITFLVSAVFENDDNIPSEPFSFKLRPKSKIPANDLPEQKAPIIHWTEAKSDYFRFKWKYSPKAKDMEWFGYLVYYRSAHVVSDFTIYNTLDENVEVASVEPETPYEAKVVAYNQHGVSEFSDVITITTEARSNNVSDPTGAELPTVTTLPPPTTLQTQEPINKDSNQTHQLSITSTPVPPIEIKSNITENIHHISTNKRPNTTLVEPMNTTNSTSNSTNHLSYRGVINQLFGDQLDEHTISRYLIIVLAP